MSRTNMSTSAYMAQFRKPMPMRRLSHAAPGRRWVRIMRAPWALMRKHGDNVAQEHMRSGVCLLPLPMRQRIEARLHACFMRAVYLFAMRNVQPLRSYGEHGPITAGLWSPPPMRKPAPLMRPKRARARIHADRLDVVIKIVHVLGVCGVIVYKPRAWPVWKHRPWTDVHGARVFVDSLVNHTEVQHAKVA